MWWTVFRVELRSAWREQATWAVIGIFAVLVAYATVGGWTFTRAERQGLTQQVQADAERRAVLRASVQGLADGAAVESATDPRQPLVVGNKLAPRVAALPPGPLAVVAVGQRDVLPQAVSLTLEARVADAAHDDGSSPSRRANGPFDLAFVLVFLLPLLVIALSYDLLAGERERGTLALVLSQPVSLTSFVLGKALARAALVVAVVLALGLVAPVALGGGLTEAGGPLRLALYVGTLVAYALFWFALAVAVDAWGSSPAANALALVGLWLGLVVVVPGLVSVAVDTLHPSPSRVELVNLARGAARDAQARASTLEGDHGKAPAAEELGRRTLALQDDLAQQLGPVLDRFDAQQGKRQGLVDQLRFASPAIVLAEALTDVAGASLSRHRAFSAQADAFHAELRRFFGDRVEAGALLGAADYDAMPTFTFREPPEGALVARVLASTAGLLLPAAAALLAARAGLRRQLERGFR